MESARSRRHATGTVCSAGTTGRSCQPARARTQPQLAAARGNLAHRAPVDRRLRAAVNRDLATLLDIATAARLVVDFISGLTAPDFLRDAKTQSAVQHQLLIIGEAVKRLSPALRAQHPTIPWTAMAAMRDQLIH